VTEEPPNYPPPPPGGYGSPPPPAGYGYQPPPQATGTNGMAIASLVCSLLGWLCIIGPILGIIFGFLALGQIKQSGQGGRGMAIAGIIIGAVVIVILIVLVTLGAVFGNTSNTKSGAPAVVITVEQQPVLAAVTM
jgi:fumarate reductase subunit D